jgi:hypothetical protein
MPKLTLAAAAELAALWPVEFPSLELSPPSPPVAETPTAANDGGGAAITLALDLLHRLAENPYVLASVRMQARHHFRQLEKARARAMADELVDEGEGELD